MSGLCRLTQLGNVLSVGVSQLKVRMPIKRIVNAQPAETKKAETGQVVRNDETKAPVPAFGSTEAKDHDLSGSLFNPAEGYLQGSEWSTSFAGMATQPFDPRISEILMSPLTESEIEIKPDGLLYLPEIKYRRILNRAFGPGGWGLVPRGAHSVAGRTLSREYALICLGRFISQARGEQDYFDEGALATATEGCKSNALVRCCKDLGVASELWDPSFINQFKAKYCVEEWVTHAVKGNKKRMWRLKTRQWEYPWAKK
ncbi:hypothetical protein GGI15_001612 [Coemansia interrupta]|uniref:Mitochondrial genome maintenance protein MGM101 n=1 Tax=Coemansia interrupta TaxID=1126814 RepID=A0A9W8LMS7_9FUNG|nr:hypothetical protein GGI15_001612 [Coemansia interrupta]